MNQSGGSSAGKNNPDPSAVRSSSQKMIAVARSKAKNRHAVKRDGSFLSW
jgi:hypothetical protein